MSMMAVEQRSKAEQSMANRSGQWSLVLAISLLVSSLGTGCEGDEKVDGVYITVDTSVFLGVETNRAWNYGMDFDDSWPGPEDLQLFLRSQEPVAAGIPFLFNVGYEDQIPEELATVIFDVDGNGDTVVTEIAVSGGEAVAFDPPAVFGLGEWDTGDSVSSATSFGGSDIQFDVTLVQRGEHEVYYGYFPDVAVLEVSDGGATPLGGSWYLAADVGTIRFRTDDDTIPDMEMVTYR